MSHPYEPGWALEKLAAAQGPDLDIGPILKRKQDWDNRLTWEDVSPEARETKILWRQWERLFLIQGVLHHQFYELDGHGWRYQLVVLEGQQKNLMHRMHGGATGELVLLEHGFFTEC